MVVPSVTALGMDPCMTLLAQGNEVTPVMRSTLGQRFLVVYLFGLHQDSLGIALLTERVLCCIAVTDSLPCPSIPTAYSRISVVLLVAFVLLFLMLLAEPSVS